MKLSLIQKLYSTLSTITQISMPIRIAYKFTKLSSKIEEDYNFYLTKTREIIFKYAKIDDDGQIVHFENGNIAFKADCISQAEQELRELEDLEVDLPDITFTLDELDCLQIAPIDLKNLMHFIQE